MSISSNVISIEDFKIFRNKKNAKGTDNSEATMFGKGLTDETMSYLTQKFSNPV
ncbi:hypothetical protein LEP1GSC102_1660 [Leptospira interrogans str. UI 09600]|nr:hypothetical protein LEP1GSC102_1660 [Leptospira interrogans str. UI 09600]